MSSSARTRSGPRPPGGDDPEDDDPADQGRPDAYYLSLPAEAPRAPSAEAWALLTPEGRAAAIEALECSESQEEVDERNAMAEGDAHAAAKEEARDTLREFFRRSNRRIYVGADIKVYYPGEKGFTPDVIAVRDTEPGRRDSWMVSAEGKGIDLALEVHWKGRRRKDFVDNVARYAALGIPEYFALDLKRRELTGWRLTPGKRTCQVLRPRWGLLHSDVLDLDLVLADGALRFHYGSAELLGGQRLVDNLNRLVDDAVTRAEEQQQRAEAERQRAEEQQQRAEAERQRASEGLSSALLAVLAARGLVVDEAQRARIVACGSTEQLGRWIGQATTAATTAELLNR